MSDKELLELAAKAAGYRLDGMFTAKNPDDMLLLNERGGHSIWNPLTYDGDTMRLAVKLELDVFGTGCSRFAESDKTLIQEDGDPYAANRRAIVRAAAAIGKDMP